MATDTRTTSAGAEGARIPGRVPAPRPPERAQLVWRRALELADSAGHHDRLAHALDLLRTAHHDPAAMAHALTLGRTHLRDNAGDAIALDGRRILQTAIAFLGARPRPDDVTGAGGR